MIKTYIILDLRGSRKGSRKVTSRAEAHHIYSLGMPVLNKLTFCVTESEFEDIKHNFINGLNN